MVGFALTQQAAASLSGDLLMLAAVVACGLGYAEGAKLTRELGGWQVISWALIMALPFMLIASLLTRPASWSAISVSAWIALGYVSLFSMLIGFIFWYKGWPLAVSPPSASFSYYSRSSGLACQPRCCTKPSAH